MLVLRPKFFYLSSIFANFNHFLPLFWPLFWPILERGRARDPKLPTFLALTPHKTPLLEVHILSQLVDSIKS